MIRKDFLEKAEHMDQKPVHDNVSYLESEKTPKKSIAQPNIMVVLPAYNEECFIGSMVILTRKYSDKVIVVDCGSSDRTAEIASNAGAIVINHEIKIGKGGALKAGFTTAVIQGANIIVTMDSEGKHNPADVPKLVAPIIKGEAEMVNGNRYYDSRLTPVYQRPWKRILDWFTNTNPDLKITDPQSGFLAFEASIVDVFHFKARESAIESEMLNDAVKAGIRIKEVKIGVRYDFFENPSRFSRLKLSKK